jgi:hypothetical protein
MSGKFSGRRYDGPYFSAVRRAGGRQTARHYLPDLRTNRRKKLADIQLLPPARAAVERVVVGKISLQPDDFFLGEKLAREFRAGSVAPKDSRAA